MLIEGSLSDILLALHQWNGVLGFQRNVFRVQLYSVGREGAAKVQIYAIVVGNRFVAVYIHRACACDCVRVALLRVGVARVRLQPNV